MNVILYVTRKHPPAIGGMERLSYELKQALTTHVQLLTISWGYSQKGLPFFLVYALSYAIYHLMTQPQIQVIFIGDPVLAPLALLLKYLFRKPVLVTLHGLDLTYPHPFYQYFIMGCLRKLDRFVCISEATRQIALKQGLPPERCHFIPVGINPQRFPPSPPRPHSKPCTLLTVGRLVKRKGVAWFIQEVLPILRATPTEFQYLIVGTGPEHALIMALVEQLQLTDQVQVLGQVSEEELQNLYQRADIFVMPNIPITGDLEGFGIVALEAALNGAYVVAARLEGIEAAIIHQKNGWLVTSGQAQEYAQVLQWLIQDSFNRQQLAYHAREFTQTYYNWDTIATVYTQLFEEMVTHHVNKMDGYPSLGSLIPTHPPQSQNPPAAHKTL